MFTVISSSIRYKFLLAVASACLLVLVALGVALSNLASISGSFATFVEQDQARLQAFSKMYTQGLQGGQSVRNLVLDAADKKALGNLEKSYKDFDDAFLAAPKLTPLKL